MTDPDPDRIATPDPRPEDLDAALRRKALDLLVRTALRKAVK